MMTRDRNSWGLGLEKMEINGVKEALRFILAGDSL